MTDGDQTKFACKLPPSPYPLEVDRVYHITHLRDAMRIVEDGRLKAVLFDDEQSRLRALRTAVTWLSPNQFDTTYYGTVRFTFAWADLIAGKRLFWVEEVQGRNLPTYRLLLSERDVSGLPLYDSRPGPCAGPLWLDKDVWHRSPDCIAEIVFDGDASLSRCEKIDYVSHLDWCIRGQCAELKNNRQRETGTAFGAFLLLGQSARDTTEICQRSVDWAFETLVAELGEKCRGSLDDPNAVLGVSRGALALWAERRWEDAEALVALVASKELFESAVNEIYRYRFGTPFRPRRVVRAV